MYYLNKIVGFFLNPLTAGIFLIVVGAVLARVWANRSRWLRWGCVALGVFWFWAWGCPWMTAVIGLPLEKPFMEGDYEKAVETYPKCDAIVLLGGGMGMTPGMRYPNMFGAADRVWHAARLYKAGKAPFVVASGAKELESTVPLLLDLGVPREAIRVDNESRNTYENARFTERLLGGEHRRVLLVTSAWHMVRALGNFSKTSLECIPAACDFDVVQCVRTTRERGLWAFVLPWPEMFFVNSYLAKEWVGRFARK